MVETVITVYLLITLENQCSLNPVRNYQQLNVYHCCSEISYKSFTILSCISCKSVGIGFLINK